MRISPTRSRSKAAVLGLLTLFAAFAASAATPAFEVVPTRDRKVVRRWSIEGDPRGIALGKNGIAYVGLAGRQSVVAVDLNAGSIKREVILDQEHIAATKELVTLRTNPAQTRLYVANGSDESATILSLPDLAVVREITMEGELIRDAVPDPAGRLLFLLGRRIHIYDADGRTNLRTLPFEDPMAIAVNSNGTLLAAVGTHDFGNAEATVVVYYDLKTFQEIGREPLQTDKAVEAAMFASNDRALVALSRENLYEQAVSARKSTVAQVEGTKAQLRMQIGFGDLVNSERICLPENSGPQILTAGSSAEMVVFAERRCSSSGAFAGSDRRITPASLYGVNAYAIAYDASSSTLVATDSDGHLTVYRMPRPAMAR